jgi:hypothetical protein
VILHNNAEGAVVKVRLADLVEALEYQSDDAEAWVDLKTGRVVLVLDEALGIAQSGAADYPEWVEAGVAEARAFLEDSEVYLALPDQYDADEYGMMNDFAMAVSDEAIKRSLLDALAGRGGF